MKTQRAINLCFTAILVVVSAYGCKEKYFPTIKDVTLNYLVVEGFINTGADSTIFTLSRTFKLENKPVEAPEKGALVQVENDAGAIYVLPELTKSGRYGRPPLGSDPTKKYRLRVRTKDNREYLSDFVESKASADFELTYKIKEDAIDFFVDSYDPSGKSIYYRHSYVETWQYESQLWSFHKDVNGNPVLRKFPDEDVRNCWHILPSSPIVLTTTHNLSEDRITKRNILTVPEISPKLDLQYSVLVKQTVLTKEGFEFYESLRNNTESVGTIFDPQPSQLYSNIRSVSDPNENVIGFISAGSVVEKRFMIHIKDLPQEWFSIPDKSICLESAQYKIVPGDKYVWVDPPFEHWRTILIYCGDCRALGGSTQRPAYW